MSASSTVPRYLRSWQSWLFISQRGQPAPLHPFLINVVVSGFCAGALAIWVFLCSDWWGAIYTVLFGGSLATVFGTAWAVVRGLPYGKRVKALPRWARMQPLHPTPGFSRVTKILNRLSLSICLVFLLAFGLTFLTGSLVVVRQSAVSSNDGLQGARILGPGNEGNPQDIQFGKHFLSWASWLHRKPGTVRVTGYPDRTAVIRPWFPAKIIFPDSFVDRPMTLVIVNPILSCSDVPGCRLQITLRGPNRHATENEGVEFAKGVFWVGCEGSVKVPPTLVQQLGTALSDPIPSCQVATELQVGDTLAMTLRRSGSMIGCGKVSITAKGIPDDFQKVLVVDPVAAGGQC